MKRARRGNRTAKEGHAASSGEVRNQREVGADQIGLEPNRRRWQILAAVLLIVIVSGIGWWNFSNRVPSIPIPEISLQEAAPSVREAITAARMALRGDGNHFVSLDKVIKTMRETGADMQTKYKETARGGLAVNIVEC